MEGDFSEEAEIEKEQDPLKNRRGSGRVTTNSEARRLFRRSFPGCDTKCVGMQTRRFEPGDTD